MIVHTANEKIAALLAPYSLLMPDDDHAFCMAPATVQQLDRLCTVLTDKYAGQWSVTFDGHPANLSYEDLTAGVDGEIWQAFMLAPGYIGADTEDLVYWLEEVYGQPVTNDNYKRVAQLFRFWYAATHPGEYHNPPAAQPAKFAELTLRESPETRRERHRRQQKDRTERLRSAAQSLGLDTIDKLVAAVLALNDDDAAKLRRCFEEVTRR